MATRHALKAAGVNLGLYLSLDETRGSGHRLARLSIATSMRQRWTNPPTPGATTARLRCFLTIIKGGRPARFSFTNQGGQDSYFYAKIEIAFRACAKDGRHFYS